MDPVSEHAADDSRGTPRGTDSRSAFRALVSEIVDPVRRYLWRRTDETTADEVLAETLVVLWRRFSEVPEERIAYAIGIARLQLANAQRARRRREQLAQRILSLDPPAETAATLDAAPDTSRDDAVRRTLGRLRPAEAELLRLWVWEELEPRQIAAVLGITANAAGVRLHRARKRFEALFRKDPENAGQIEVKEGEHR